jgi:hypothetical protein
VGVYQQLVAPPTRDEPPPPMADYELQHAYAAAVRYCRLLPLLRRMGKARPNAFTRLDLRQDFFDHFFNFRSFL